MNLITNLKTYTASEAREKLYTLVRLASSNLSSFEINLRGENPVVLINKSELEAWQETLDILTHKKEIMAIRKARKEKRMISHKKLLKSLKYKE